MIECLIVFDREKFAELILYIARRSEGDPSFGATKLNKILFFSDFVAYRKSLRPITGATYQKLPYGPVPRELPSVKQELEASGDATEVERDYFGRKQRCMVTRREPRLGRFTGEEIAIVGDVIAELRNLDASGSSEISHEFIGWKYANLGEEIPYETALLTFGTLTQKDIEIGRSLARKYGWAGVSAK